MHKILSIDKNHPSEVYEGKTRNVPFDFWHFIPLVLNPTLFGNLGYGESTTLVITRASNRYYSFVLDRQVQMPDGPGGEIHPQRIRPLRSPAF